MRAKGETTVVIGRDGRLSGPDLAAALAEGLQAAGVDVIDIGVVATPMVYFATNMLEARSGIMVTGSHNPPDYNGFKMVLAGEAIYGDAITALYRTIDSNGYATRAGQLPHARYPRSLPAAHHRRRQAGAADEDRRSTAATAWPALSPATCTAAWAAKSPSCSAKSTATSPTTTRTRRIRKTCRT